MSGLKTLAVAGMGAEGAFGTGVAVTQDLKLLSESLRVGSAPRSSEFTGGRAREYVGKGLITVAGGLTEHLRYLLTTDPAHILLKQAFGAAFGHIYRNLLRESWVSLRLAAADNQELALSVTPATTGSAGVQVRLRLRRVGNPSGNLTVELQTDTAGDPSGTPVANGTSAAVSAASITADSGGQDVTFTFATSPTLTASTAYHAVLKGTYTASATDYIDWAVEDVASGGNFEIKDAAWANDATKNGVGRILTTSFIDAFLMANTIEGQSATLAIDKGQAVHEFLGMKVRGCTITSTPAGMLQAAYELVGYDEDQSPTNTAAAIQGLRRVRDYPLHSDLTAFWVGDQVDALAVGDAWKIDSWELALARALDNTPVSGQRQILEPLENGSGDVTLAVKLPRYASDQWRTWQAAETKLQVRSQWTDGSKYLTFLAANAIIDGAVPIETGDKAAYSQEVTLRCFKNGGTNGLIALEDECELSLLNV